MFRAWRPTGPTDRPTDRTDRTGHKQIPEGILICGAPFPRLTFFAEYVLRRFGKDELAFRICNGCSYCCAILLWVVSEISVK